MRPVRVGGEGLPLKTNRNNPIGKKSSEPTTMWLLKRASCQTSGGGGGVSRVYWSYAVDGSEIPFPSISNHLGWS